MLNLAQRLQEILDKAKVSRADMARAAGVTEAAVTHWMDGSTRSLRGVTAARLESAYGFRAAWIASGKGVKLVAPSEEGDMLLPHEVELIEALRQLTEDEQRDHLRAITSAAMHNRAVLAQHLKRMGIDEPTQTLPPRRLPKQT